MSCSLNKSEQDVLEANGKEYKDQLHMSLTCCKYTMQQNIANTNGMGMGLRTQILAIKIRY